MKLFVVPVLVALLAQFGSLPLLAGRGSSAGELIVWPMIMAIFFGVPSLVVYSAIFGGFRIMSPPPIICLLLGIGIPAAIVMGF
ncbi:hypothetical protein [Croceicoccus marinus]|jgi:hypothetical protein|uniref:Uncharacterized protein n=1 Tax=Croceicoccus marinus TaxID=450378 RepID=A0A7G6VV62_9SPHN|nr:hypothetical protein [Croceicoccus marinus]QNE05627.1 hypothetical protein H4O24_02730 [Croceicoccus marinus]